MKFRSTDALGRVAAYFRALIAARANPLRVPPFSLLLDAASANTYRNYAFPDDGADPDPAAIGRLVAAFEARERIPRLEYIPALAPRLEKGLAAAGFVREGEAALLRCTAETLRPWSIRAGIDCRLALSREALRGAAEVQNAAYGAGAVTPGDLDRLQRTVDEGGLVALALRGDGKPVGSGLVTAPLGGVAEIAAVGVVESERRRGAGSAVTAFLAERALAAGVDLPFLMSVQEAETCLYRRIGFSRFGTMLHISRK
jgi:hypothetical protein